LEYPPGGLMAAGLFFVFGMPALQARRFGCKSGSGPQLFAPAMPAAVNKMTAVISPAPA
jgi:hypothetical protein